MLGHPVPSQTPLTEAPSESTQYSEHIIPSSPPTNSDNYLQEQSRIQGESSLPQMNLPPSNEDISWYHPTNQADSHSQSLCNCYVTSNHPYIFNDSVQVGCDLCRNVSWLTWHRNTYPVSNRDIKCWRYYVNKFRKIKSYYRNRGCPFWNGVAAFPIGLN